jgi:NAD(P)H-dependent flavin oxidoreductase YrpB (nitropropane dioxygenase family)
MNTDLLHRLQVPIVQAPLAGGPSTPELAAAVSGAGGLGFIAAGYKAAEALAADIDRTRALTDRPLGVNLFAPSGTPAEPEVVERYAARLEPEARRAGVTLGKPRGAAAAQLGTAFMRCPEAATAPAKRESAWRRAEARLKRGYRPRSRAAALRAAETARRRAGAPGS